MCSVACLGQIKVLLSRTSFWMKLLMFGCAIKAFAELIFQCKFKFGLRSVTFVFVLVLIFTIIHLFFYPSHLYFFLSYIKESFLRNNGVMLSYIFFNQMLIPLVKKIIITTFIQFILLYFFSKLKHNILIRNELCLRYYLEDQIVGHTQNN